MLVRVFRNGQKYKTTSAALGLELHARASWASAQKEEMINNLTAVGTIVNTAAETASCSFILSINYPEQKIIFPKLLVVQER